jgi:hypothetical protein
MGHGAEGLRNSEVRMRKAENNEGYRVASIVIGAIMPSRQMSGVRYGQRAKGREHSAA